MNQPLIDLVNISKSFDGELILDDLNLSVKENSFVTLLCRVSTVPVRTLPTLTLAIFSSRSFFSFSFKISRAESTSRFSDWSASITLTSMSFKR